MKKLLIFSIIAVFVCVSAFAEYQREDQAIAKYYNNARVVKVKYSQGDAYVSRSFDSGREEAGVNIPIFEKDIAGTNDGRLDIYLGRSNFLRLDYDTEVEFQRVPELRKTNLRIFVRRGGIYLDIHNLDYAKDIELQTPDCGVFILNRGVYRINYNGARGTEIFVIEGLAEVAGENTSRNVVANQKIVMREGFIHERPFYFYTSDNDGFDLWNKERHDLVSYARSSSSRYLDSGYEDYEYELSRSGRWRYSSTYRTNIWIPYNVGSSWRPYYNGRWVWTPSYGYYWYSYDPWNSFTYHYGRWHYDSFWGWHWLPGYRWSPAWVGWCYSDSYYGWTPLSRYNRPVIVVNKRWLRNYNYRDGIPWRSQSSVFVKKGLMGRSIKKVALRRGSAIKSVKRGLKYSGINRAGKLKYSHVKVKNSRGKTVSFKKGGLRSSNYKSVRYKKSSGIESRTVYKYRKGNSAKSNTFKYSGSVKSKRVKGVSSRNYKSIKKTSSRVKNTSSSRYGTRVKKSSDSGYKTRVIKSSNSRSGKKIKKKKRSGVPSFSYRKYSDSKNSGYYSSKSAKAGITSKYKYNNSSRYGSKKYSPRTSDSFSYKKKSYSSGSSYNFSKPNYNSSRSNKRYKSYSPKKSIFSSRKSYGIGSSSYKYSKPNYSSRPSYQKSRSYSRPKRVKSSSGSSRSKSYSSSRSSSRSRSRGISSRRSSVKTSSSRSSSGSSSSSGKAKRKK